VHTSDRTRGGFPRVDLKSDHVRSFLNAYLRDRIPPLLFIGPEGVGKEHAAVDFARLICCNRRPKCELAGTLCESCQKAVRLEHHAIHFVYPTPSMGGGEKPGDDETEIGKILDVKRLDFFDTHRFAKKVSIRIARARAIIQRANIKPFGSGRNVFLVCRADLMREEAQNAILKLVEEPPGHTVLICLTENLDSILPTIRSRCQRLRFSPLRSSLVEGLLVDYYSTPVTAARVAAPMSQGSIRRAREIVAEQDDVGRKHAYEIVAGLVDAPQSWVIKNALMVSRYGSRDSVARFLHELASAYRDIMTGEESLFINQDQARMLAAQTGNWDPRRVPAVLDRIIETHDEILRRNLNMEAALVDLFLDIKHLRC